MQWNNLSEHPAPEGEWVLFCEEDKEIELGMSLDGMMCLPNLGYLQKPKAAHWMELPDPPIN